MTIPVQPQQAGREVIRDVIAEHFDLGDVGLPMPLAVAHQRRHRKLLVETTEGEFLVKTYHREPVTLDALRFQHRLSDFLRLNDLPVAHIQRAKDGRRVVEVDNWAFELQQYIRGDPMRISSATLTVSADALGRLHELCRDFPRPPRDARMWRFSEVPRKEFGRLYEMALEEASSARVDRCCNRIALFIKEAAEALSFEKRKHFETGLIHGDWHSGNLLFKGDQLIAIVDFEFAGEGCYLEDIAYAISNLCVRTSTDPCRLEKRTDILLKQYQKYRTLSFFEELALYYAVGIKHIVTVAYQMHGKRRQVAGHGPAEWMERLSHQCDWLESRTRELRGL